MRILASLVMIITLLCATGCNEDEPKFTSEQIKNAIFDLKGTYHGKMRVSYFQGATISDYKECKAVSRDSLVIDMDLAQMAESIEDENIATLLRQIGVVNVKAGYEFLQMDEMLHFVLHPADVIVPPGYGAPPSVRIVFSQNFGGDATPEQHTMMFNLSPAELWIGSSRYEPFKQIVFHFEGEYE